MSSRVGSVGLIAARSPGRPCRPRRARRACTGAGMVRFRLRPFRWRAPSVAFGERTAEPEGFRASSSIKEPVAMKRHSYLAILALSAILLLTPLGAPVFAAAPAVANAAAAAPAAAHSKAVAVTPIKDVGSVPKGDKITQDFEIRNDGNAALEITDVKAACGCTVASYDKTIGPGKTGKVHVVVDTSSFSGPVAKGVTVFTNDAANPQVELTVRAKVEPYIAVKPGFVRYSIVKDEAKEGTIAQTLYTPDGSPMDDVKVDSPWPYLAVSFREAQEGERLPDVKVKQWRVETKLSSDAPVGPLAGYVTVHTNHAKQKLVEIPVSGFVRPALAVTPPKADFGLLDVKTFATEPIRVTGVDPPGQGIEAKVEPLEEGREYTVRLTLNSAMAKGPFHGKLTIHTDSPKSPVLEVELSG